MKQKWLVVLMGVGVGLVCLAAILWIVLSQQEMSVFDSASAPVLSVTPMAELEAPASLEELAAQYPELSRVLTDPELGSIYKEFLIAYKEGGLEAALTLAGERELLTPDGRALQAMLVLDTEDHTLLVQQLEAAGVTVVSAYRDRVNIAVPLDLVEAQLSIAEPAALFAQLTELQHVVAVRLPARRSTEQSTIDGEGIAVIGADAWQQAGFRGEGLRIGVLDLGFAGYEDLLGVELPALIPLETFGWYDEGEAHGTACAEIIHEVAPAAELVFAWYDGSDAAFGEAVDWLLTQDVNIISHSAGGVVSPRDGSGWDSRLVDELGGMGLLWVNAAGNEGDMHYRDTFKDENGNGQHEFESGEEWLAIYNYGYSVEVYMMWDDSWDYPTQDYDLSLMSSDGETLAVSEEPQSGSVGEIPAEWVGIETSEDVVYVMIHSYEADRPVTFDLFIQGNAELEVTSPAYSVNSPGDAVGSLTVGAVEWDGDRLAVYSSQGPTLDGRLKPEISAPTGVSGVTYGRRGFDGTSASTPHVAGAAALIWQAYPEFSRQQLVDYLLDITVDLGPAGPDTGYGYGRLQLPAPPAVDNVAPFPIHGQPTPDLQGGVVQPLPTPTAVAFATPEATPYPSDRRNDGLLGAALFGVLILGFGFIGFVLIVIAGFLFIRLHRSKKVSPKKNTAFLHSAPLSSLATSPQKTETSAQPPVGNSPGIPSSLHPNLEALSSVKDGSSVDFGGSVHGQILQPDFGVRQDPTVTCSACGASTRPGARFCSACGVALLHAEFAPLPIIVQDEHSSVLHEYGHCPHCGAAVRQGAKFCANCGVSFSASTADEFSSELVQASESIIQPVEHCPYCEALLRDGSRFCPQCGQPVRGKNEVM